MSHRGSSKNTEFLQRLIRRYYRGRPLAEPYYLPSREVAIYSLEDQAYIRHLSFSSMNLLYQYITKRKTPLHLHYSSAYYEDPAAERMEDKQWIGSDLIFDIDSDHFEGCSGVVSICIKENKHYSGKVKKCGNGEKPVVYPLMGFKCIERGWEEARRLVEILRDDMGFKEITVSFSGNRGFHVHVYDEDAKKLTGEERREIVDYTALKNIDYTRVIPPIGRRQKTVFFTNYEKGWRRRLLEELVERGVAENVGGLYKASFDDAAEALEELGINLDPVVTMDVSRLSRFDYSIHGKSGLVVYPLDYSREELPVKGFTGFSPFQGKVRVKPLIDFPAFPVLDSKISLRRGMRLRLDAPYALYLVLKGIVVVEDPGEAEEIVV